MISFDQALIKKRGRPRKFKVKRPERSDHHDLTKSEIYKSFKAGASIEQIVDALKDEFPSVEYRHISGAIRSFRNLSLGPEAARKAREGKPRKPRLPGGKRPRKGYNPKSLENLKLGPASCGPKYDQARIVALRKRGLEYKQIAAEVGCSIDTIYRALAKAKVTGRNRSV